MRYKNLFFSTEKVTLSNGEEAFLNDLIALISKVSPLKTLVDRALSEGPITVEFIREPGVHPAFWLIRERKILMNLHNGRNYSLCAAFVFELLNAVNHFGTKDIDKTHEVFEKETAYIKSLRLQEQFRGSALTQAIFREMWSYTKEIKEYFGTYKPYVEIMTQLHNNTYFKDLAFGDLPVQMPTTMTPANRQLWLAYAFSALENRRQRFIEEVSRTWFYNFDEYIEHSTTIVDANTHLRHIDHYRREFDRLMTVPGFLEDFRNGATDEEVIGEFVEVNHYGAEPTSSEQINPTPLAREAIVPAFNLHRTDPEITVYLDIVALLRSRASEDFLRYLSRFPEVIKILNFYKPELVVRLDTALQGSPRYIESIRQFSADELQRFLLDFAFNQNQVILLSAHAEEFKALLESNPDAQRHFAELTHQQVRKLDAKLSEEFIAKYTRWNQADQARFFISLKMACEKQTLQAKQKVKA